ncbi:hypothetical protein AC1031_016781 [Aphanomyces cochlioides]|nr:hypothetical protein AC1031_016781 [Aphanomyces cochlioides]
MVFQLSTSMRLSIVPTIVGGGMIAPPDQEMANLSSEDATLQDRAHSCTCRGFILCNPLTTMARTSSYWKNQGKRQREGKEFKRVGDSQAIVARHGEATHTNDKRTRVCLAIQAGNVPRERSNAQEIQEIA